MRERANLDSNSNGHQHVFAEMHEAEKAARRLGVDCVQRDRRTGAWRPAANTPAVDDDLGGRAGLLVVP